MQFLPKVLLFLVIPLLTTANKNKISPKQFVIAVDTEEDLRRSGCNNGVWFQYASRTADLLNAPKIVTGGFGNASGVWFLQKDPIGRINFDKRSHSPCMEYSLRAQLCTELEIQYFFYSRGGSSSFTIFNNAGGESLINITKSSPQTQNPTWETARVKNGEGIHCGFFLQAEIESGDFLLIDKVIVKFL